MKKNKSIKKNIFACLLLLLVSFACLSFAEAAVTMPATTGLANRSVKEVLSGILKWMLGVVGIIALIGFSVSGIMYLVSAGNDDMAKKAKSAMKYSIIGIAVVLGSFVIIQALDRALSGSVTQF